MCYLHRYLYSQSRQAAGGDTRVSLWVQVNLEVGIETTKILNGRENCVSKGENYPPHCAKWWRSAALCGDRHVSTKCCSAIKNLCLSVGVGGWGWSPGPAMRLGGGGRKNNSPLQSIFTLNFFKDAETKAERQERSREEGDAPPPRKFKHLN